MFSFARMAFPSNSDHYPPTEKDSDCGDGDKIYAKIQASLRAPKVPSASKAIKSKTYKASGVSDGPNISKSSKTIVPVEENISIIGQDILRLTPLNTEAKQAFDSVALLQKAGKLDEVHSQHIKVTDIGSLSCTTEKFLSDTDINTDEASSEAEGVSSQRIVYKGYFRVRFDLPSVSAIPVWVCIMHFAFFLLNLFSMSIVAFIARARILYL